MLSIFFAATLSSSSASPCDIATKDELQRVLGGPAVPLSADELGELTAPSCHWADINTWARASIEIWSPEELPVLRLRDGIDYYAKLKTEEPASVDLPGIGDKAFVVYPEGSGVIAVLKGERVFLFGFAHVREDRARLFVIDVMARQ